MLVFFGSNNFAKIFLENLGKRILPDLVITKPASQKGRKKILALTPVETLAKSLGLKTLTPTDLKDENFLKTLKKYQNGIFLIAEYGKIIPEQVLNIPKYKTINIHPSLLPKFRGPTPIQTALLNQEKSTGLTIHLTEKEVDTGDILAQKQVKIGKNDNYLTLEKKLAILGAEMFMGIFDKWLESKISPTPQNNNLATYTKKFSFQDGLIKPCQETASQIQAKIKALNPEPGTYLQIKRKNNPLILKIFEIETINQNSHNCSQFFEFQKQLALKCKDKSILIKNLQLSGKKPTNSKSFLAGNKWILEN